jgi:hypothetical protein
MLTGNLHDLPLIVLSGENHDPLYSGQNVDLELSRHETLARQSTRGKHIVVANSGFWNPYTSPRAVIEAVRDLSGETH